MRGQAILIALFFGMQLCTAQIIFNLKKALQSAKENNAVLKTQFYDIAIAETDILAARMRPNPVLNNQSLQLISSNYFPPNTIWNNGHNRQIWWQLTKEFQIAGQRKHKIQLAEKNVAFAEKVFNENERTIFLEVAGKWLNVWTIRKQLDILLMAKANADSLVYINKLRLKNQMITQNDLTRAELLASQFALKIKSTEQSYKSELLAFKLVIGAQQDVDIDTTDNFNYTPTPKLDSLLMQALSKRSDVLAIRSSIDAAEANITLQKRLRWPNPELGAIYNPQNTVPYLGFYGTIPIPVFSRNQAERKKSLIVKQQAEQELSTTQQKIQSEITSSFNIYQIQKINLQSFDQLLEQSESILSSVKYAYLRGGTNIIDYLEAQRSWLETRQQYYETLQAYRQSYIQLLYLSGLINPLAQ